MNPRRRAELEALLSRPQGRSIWMVSFIDALSLVLSFFILVYSMATPDVERFRQMADGLTSCFTNAGVRPQSTPSPGLIAPTVERSQALNLDYLASLLQAQLAREPALAHGIVQRLSDRLVLSFPGELLFQSNKAELTQAAERALFQLGGVLSQLDNRIDVQGHADPASVAGGGFADNWELSIVRALAVREVLARSGYRRPLVAQGLADTRYGELSTSLPERWRQQLARRVDVVIYPSAGERS
jgi:chemotaxis protein MotB